MDRKKIGKLKERLRPEIVTTLLSNSELAKRNTAVTWHTYNIQLGGNHGN
jgi:hypothetical protein